jgi:hypothetical protein
LFHFLAELAGDAEEILVLLLEFDNVVEDDEALRDDFVRVGVIDSGFVCIVHFLHHPTFVFCQVAVQTQFAFLQFAEEMLDLSTQIAGFYRSAMKIGSERTFLE